MYVKDLFQSKYQLLINRREKVETNHTKNPKTFIDYSEIIDYVYKNLEDYNPTKKKVSNEFNDMIADREANKKLIPKVTEFFMRSKKGQHLTCFDISILFQSALI